MKYCDIYYNRSLKNDKKGLYKKYKLGRKLFNNMK